MDWYTLVDQVLLKEKQSVQNGENRESVNADDLTALDGKLEELEIQGLLCVLNSLSLQLYILHARLQDNSILSNSTSAKKIYEVIEKTKSELAEFGTFASLHEKVRQELIVRRSNSHVERKNAEYAKRIYELQHQIRSNDRIKLKEIHKKQEVIASLKDEVQNLIAKSESTTRYVERLQNARQGMNQRQCESAEAKLKKELEEVNSTYNNEIRVSESICTFLNGEIQKLESEIEWWKKRYQEEMQKRNESIKKLKEKAKEQQFKFQELKQLFNSRQMEMEDYLRFIEEKKREEERNKFIYDSATKIQAWWRGTMVRRGLGPYKRRKKIVKDKKKGK